MFNWIWILNNSMTGLNSIISLNQDLANNHIKVLTIIKLDNGRGQISMGFHIAWISAIKSSVFVLITYTKHHFLKQSVQETREYYSQLTRCNSLFKTLSKSRMWWETKQWLRVCHAEYTISPLTNASSAFQTSPPQFVCIWERYFSMFQICPPTIISQKAHKK